MVMYGSFHTIRSCLTSSDCIKCSSHSKRWITLIVQSLIIICIVQTHTHNTLLLLLLSTTIKVTWSSYEEALRYRFGSCTFMDCESSLAVEPALTFRLSPLPHWLATSTGPSVSTMERMFQVLSRQLGNLFALNARTFEPWEVRKSSAGEEAWRVISGTIKRRPGPHTQDTDSFCQLQPVIKYITVARGSPWGGVDRNSA